VVVIIESERRRPNVRTSSETIKTAMVAGSAIEYSDRGEGEPLLLVHAGVFADWFLPLAAN
jgi:hypothetical protein